MKKQFLTLLFFSATIAIQAQTLQPTNCIKNKLAVNKTIVNKTSSGTSINGMDINTNTNSTSVINIKITPNNNDSGAIETIFKKIKMSAETMGRKMEFDSDNPLTSTYAATEELSKMAGSSIKYYINKKGIVTSIDTTQKIGISPKLDMMQFGGMSVGADCNLFLNITSPINIGDVWTDSILVSNSKINKKYTYKSYKNGIATIDYTSIIEMNGETEQMGMKVKMKQHGTSNGTMTINTNNLLITSNEYTLNISGTVEAAGKLMPSKITTEVFETTEQ